MAFVERSAKGGRTKKAPMAPIPGNNPIDTDDGVFTLDVYAPLAKGDDTPVVNGVRAFAIFEAGAKDAAGRVIAGLPLITSIRFRPGPQAAMRFKPYTLPVEVVLQTEYAQITADLDKSVERAHKVVKGRFVPKKATVPGQAAS